MPIAIEPSVELSRMGVEVGRSMVGNARFQARRRRVLHYHPHLLELAEREGLRHEALQLITRSAWQHRKVAREHEDEPDVIDDGDKNQQR